jgi:hypothetical protein
MVVSFRRLLLSKKKTPIATYQYTDTTLAMPSIASLDNINNNSPLCTAELNNQIIVNKSHNHRVIFSHATGLHGRVWDSVAIDLTSDNYYCLSFDHRGNNNFINEFN